LPAYLINEKREATSDTPLKQVLTDLYLLFLYDFQIYQKIIVMEGVSR